MSNNLEDIVRRYVPLPNKTTPSGWYALRCPVCNDHKYKKRGGWKFDGSKTSYHCFNCPITSSYDEENGYISEDMSKILDSFGVPTDAISELKFENFKKFKGEKTTKRSQFSVREVEPIQLPKHLLHKSV